MLQFEEIRKLLIHIAQQQTVTKEDTPVLLVGSTGAGKSTLANYLLGWCMTINEDGEAIPVEASAPMRMSGRGESVTLVPQLQLGIDTTLYCDCSGFSDNRSNEVRICASVATEHIIKTARHIAGVIVVIDYDALQASRGMGFVRLLQDLVGMFSMRQGAGSVLYVVNKVPVTVSKAAIVRKLQDILVVLKTHADRADAALLLEQIVSNQHAILVADVFDNGISRVEIMRAVRSLKPLSSDAFEFQHSDPLRDELRHVLDHIVLQGLDKKERVENLPGEIQYLENTERELSQEIERQTQALTQYHATQSRMIQAGVLAQEAQRSTVDHSTVLAAKLEKKRSLENQHATLASEHAFLNSEEPVLFWEKYHRQKARFRLDSGGMGVTMLDVALTGGMLSTGVALLNAVSPSSPTKIDFDYPGPAIVRIEKDAEGGSFTSEHRNQKSGAVSWCFKSDNDKDQYAAIRVFIERRHDPKNIKKMAVITQQMDVIQEEIVFIDREISCLQVILRLSQEAYTHHSAQHHEKQDAGLPQLIQAHIQMLQNRQPFVYQETFAKKRALTEIEAQLMKEQGLYEVTADLLALLSGIEKNDVNAQKFIELFSSADVIEAPPLQEEKKSGNAMSLEAIYQDMAKMQKQILELQREVATLHKRIKLTTPLNQSDQSQTSEPTFFRKSF